MFRIFLVILSTICFIIGTYACVFHALGFYATQAEVVITYSFGVYLTIQLYFKIEDYRKRGEKMKN